MKTYIHT